MDEIMAEICEGGEVLRLVPKAPSTGLLAASSAVARWPRRRACTSDASRSCALICCSI